MADTKLSGLGVVTTLAGANKLYAEVGGVSKGITMTSIRADTETLTNKKITNLIQTNQTLTDTASIAWDMNSGSMGTVVLTDNRAMAAPTNLPNHGECWLIVKQDAGGTNTLTYDGVFLFPGGTAPVLSVGGNDIDIIQFICDGTSLFGVASYNFS